ncbi:hypothetical protein HanPSC8_Chr05g0207751 [Helianthus annuus]|nr:hypothetical protein HanPSC8_Chr05g0207751 [Helianthus annuus]
MIELPPMNSETKKAWEFKSLIGEVKDIEILNNLQEHVAGIMEDNFEMKYLGGLKVLLCFKNPEEAEDFRLGKVNVWEAWFSRLYAWDGIPPIFERVAWVKILGLPLPLWDRHVINKIDKRCGRLLVKSEADKNDGNMAEDCLAILVQSGNRISSEFILSRKEQKIKVWVEEISGQWCPSFLEKVVDEEGTSVFSGESPVLSSPAMSPGEVRSVDTGVEKTKGCPSVSPPSCMGNLRSGTFSHEHAADFSGDPCVEKADNYEERENGGDIHSVESEEREEVGHDSDGGRLGRPDMEYNSFSPRPSYITTRSNKSFGSKKQA